MSPVSPPLRISRFDRLDYLRSWRAMKNYNRIRTAASPDCAWLLQHPPTITLGVRADRAEILSAGDCQVIRSDRGGQTTYHGPGQLIGYLLIDLRRAGLGIHSLVHQTERMLCELLDTLGLQAQCIRRRPGVYVEGKKIASLGFRISRNYSYHGFSLNVNCDLEPFSRIVPCGIAGQAVTRLSDYHCDMRISTLLPVLYPLLDRYFGPRAPAQRRSPVHHRSPVQRRSAEPAPAEAPC